jgi:hypothetical protein
MRTCGYCGQQNPERSEFCAGCGTRVNNPPAGVQFRDILAAPIKRSVAVETALAVMWAPFVLCVLLSGEPQAWKYIFILPGLFLGIFLRGPAFWACAYASSLGFTLLMLGLAVVLARRSPKLFKIALAPALLGFCGLAFIALLMLRA